MATATIIKKTSDYVRLCQRLGVLDKERKDVLNQLRGTPEMAQIHVSTVMDNFMKEGRWFTRQEAEVTKFYKLLACSITSAPHLSDKRKSVLVNVSLTWSVCGSDYITKEVVEKIELSAFNEIENQILNGRVRAVKFDEKKLLKEGLNSARAKLVADKAKLDAELQKINDDLALLEGNKPKKRTVLGSRR